MDTKSARQKCEATSWNRFLTRSLSVNPEIMGLKHKFQFEKNHIEISIPDTSKVTSNHDGSDIATVSSRWASNNQPIDYDIHQVDVITNRGCSIAINPEALKKPPNAYDLYTQAEREQFQAHCIDHELLAIRAFEYWLSILRWRLDDYRIGQPEVIGNSSGWSTRLEDRESKKTIWVQTALITVQGSKKINLEEWNDIQNQLTLSKSIPIYVSLKHDAEASMKHGDYARSIVELAMACEVFMRFMVIDRLPNELKQNLVEAIEELNINQYVTKHFKSLIPEANLKEYGPLSKELSSLFSKRNKIVHIGKNEGTDRENCIRFIGVTNKLFGYHKLIDPI